MALKTCPQFPSLTLLFLFPSAGERFTLTRETACNGVSKTLMKFLEPNPQAPSTPLLLTWGSVSVLWLSQDPEVWVLSLAGPRVLHEAKVEQPNTETTCASCPHADVGSCNSVILVGNYTMFSAPGRGPCGGPRSCLLCNWASCRTGMLHSGHTFRTSSHLIRHFLWKACLHGQIPNSSLGLKSSRHTAQSSCKFSSFTFSFNITCL